MTTTPLDDPDAPAPSEEGEEHKPTSPDLPPVDERDPAAAATGVPVDTGVDRGSGDGAATTSLPPALRHPIRRWEGTGRRFLPGVSFPISVWVLWRAVHFVMSYMQVGPVTNTLESAMNVAFNYDGERYYLILHQGYANPNVMMPNTAFFPVTSWVATPIWWLTRSDGWTVHLVATITAIAAFVTIWAVTKEWRNEMVARRAVLLLAVMPSSLYLWAFYSEGIFMALGAGAVIADRKGKRGLAALLMVPLAATRSVGIVVPLVMVLARVVRSSRTDRASLRVLAAAPVASFVAWLVLAQLTTVPLGRGIPLALVALPLLVAVGVLAARHHIDRWSVAYTAAGAIGLGVVMVVLWKQVGDPLAFMKVQEDWGRQLSWPWTTIHQGFDNLYPRPETIMIPALVARNLDIWCLLIIGLPLFYSMGASLWARDRGPRTWIAGWALTLVPLFVGVIVALYRYNIVGPVLRINVPRTKHVMMFPLLYLAIVAALVVALWLIQPVAQRFLWTDDGWPMETWMIGWALIALPLCSSALASFNRFTMADWIIYPVVASFLAKLPRQIRWVPYVVLAVAGAVVSWRMIGRFSADRFVG